MSDLYGDDYMPMYRSPMLRRFEFAVSAALEAGDRTAACMALESYAEAQGVTLTQPPAPSGRGEHDGRRAEGRKSS